MSLQLPYLPPGSTFPPILNTKTDIATSLDLEQMRIRAPGRIPFQIVHLWSPPSKKKSVLKYDADTDCPKTNRHLRIPTELELIPAGEDEEGKTSAYLEIGLALSQPRDEYPLLVLKDRIEAAQSVHNNQNQNQTSKSSTKKGLLPRLPKTLRVFTPLSKNYVHPQTRCVIGVHFENGRFHPRKIGVDAVFFYPEFWYQTSFEESLAKRRNGVGLAVRFRAVCYEAGSGVVASSARDAEMGHVREIEELKDEEEEDSDHDSDDDSEEDIPEEDPTSTTTKEEGVTKAQIQRYEYIHRLPGVSSWHRFDETFSREDAKLLVAELKVRSPSNPKPSSLSTLT